MVPIALVVMLMLAAIYAVVQAHQAHVHGPPMMGVWAMLALARLVGIGVVIAVAMAVSVSLIVLILCVLILVLLDVTIAVREVSASGSILRGHNLHNKLRR